MGEPKTIEVSAEVYERLCSTKKLLAKIVRKKSISFDQLFRIFYVAQPLDTVLQEYILEEIPSVSFKKTRKQEETDEGATDEESD
jgi:predicted CopG family antitoxin